MFVFKEIINSKTEKENLKEKALVLPPVDDLVS
jgi:hypothetical protein